MLDIYSTVRKTALTKSRKMIDPVSEMKTAINGQILNDPHKYDIISNYQN